MVAIASDQMQTPDVEQRLAEFFQRNVAAQGYSMNTNLSSDGSGVDPDAISRSASRPSFSHRRKKISPESRG